MSNELPVRHAVMLLVVVVIAWGLNWPVTKLVVQSIPPLWTTAIRCWIAFFALFILLWMGKNLIIPSRDDVPVVLSLALLHMVAFSTLVAAGLQFVPASKAIVLGYTTPLWVAVGAPLFLGESVSKRQAAGVAVGLLGLIVIFSPQSMDWTDREAVYGSMLVLLASVCWAASILYVRAHQWIATPFQLLLWQLLVAAIVLSTVALTVEGLPRVDWSGHLILLLLYGGLIGTALAYWAMSMVNRSLPALTTSIGVMATPLIGIASAAIFLGETIDRWLFLAATLIVAGIATCTLTKARASQSDR